MIIQKTVKLAMEVFEQKMKDFADILLWNFLLP